MIQVWFRIQNGCCLVRWHASYVFVGRFAIRLGSNQENRYRTREELCFESIV